MKQISLLIKPASSICNLQCSYCFYDNVSDNRAVKSHGIMSLETTTKLIERVLNTVDQGQINIAFQGGEPTVAGLEYFKTFVSQVNRLKNIKQQINYSIQTNGIVIDNEWCIFFKENNFLVGISIDGYRENHDYYRLSKNKRPTFKQVMAATKLFNEYGIEYNVLTVLTKTLVEDPLRLFRFYVDNKFDYIQLIPCLGELGKEEDKFALTSELFTSFYTEFYKLWENEYHSGHYISVGLFDNLVLMMKGVPPTQCGMLGFCSMQWVVESNGDVYPCDFYVLDEYCGGNIHDSTLEEIMGVSGVNNFIEEKLQLPHHCDNCSYYDLCQGNCKRLRTIYTNDDGCGYQKFLDCTIESMIKIANKL